ncbi:prorelaxin 1-like [Chionomys nivalis]|uniref:prorelaxin 1-like n=1 Tax=Chionomys nivalis TaxID=269649 RepID=UPI0025946DAC|nr:prorelaxin 1-like [Chionomys nivalis]
MSNKFLLPLLGLWLLLSQPCRARVTEEWLDEVIKVCDRIYVRTVIEICGTSMLVDRKAPARRQRSIAETVPSFNNKDAAPSDMMLKYLPNWPQKLKVALPEERLSLPELQQHAPALSNSAGSPEGLEKGFHKTQVEAEASSSPETKRLRLDALARRKRQSRLWLSEQCCHFGCPRRAIAQFC